jgi:hypothetical protein
MALGPEIATDLGSAVHEISYDGDREIEALHLYMEFFITEFAF